MTHKMYTVEVRANAYDGKYYDYSSAPVHVWATSKEDAINIVKTRKDDTNSLLSKLRYNNNPSGKYLIPRRPSVESNTFIEKTSYARELLPFKLIGVCLSQEGIIHTSKLEEYL